MAGLINMRDISQEQMDLLVLFDRLSKRDLNLLNVVADELPVDRDLRCRPGQWRFESESF